MKLMLFAAVLLMSSAMFAQTTHTFTFGSDASGPYGAHSGCASFLTIDGNQPNEAIGYSGSVCWPGTSENPWWGLQAPEGPYLDCQQGSTEVCGWGFPNNGFLENNNVSPSSIGPYTWGAGCGPTTAGCVGSATATDVFSGYGQGVTITVNVLAVVHKHSYCGRGGCHTYYTVDETNGSGTAVYQ